MAKSTQQQIEYQKEYRIKNKSKIREQKRQYRIQHLKEEKERSLKWLRENPEKAKENRKNWAIKNPKKVKKSQQKSMRELRLKILSYYGGKKPKCSHCGHSNYDCLDIDHIGNDGKDFPKHQKSGHGLYYWIIRNDFPSNFQVLCKNCNWLKYLETLKK